jgi:hypothetical protein
MPVIIRKVVIVNDGIYDLGGRIVYGQITNRVILTDRVIVKSMNGPTETFIVGSGATRCAYVEDSSVLSGFTLTNGHSSSEYFNELGSQNNSGGGVFCEIGGIVSNCVLIGNSAYSGGSASGGMFYDCAFTGNSAVYGGACMVELSIIAV